MKVLLFTSISLVILLGCQDNTAKSGHIPIDNHHVPIVKTCCHCKR